MTTTAIPSKQCSQCREVKHLADFHLRARSRDGRQSKCAACARELRRLWRKERGGSPEQKAAARERTRVWRERNSDRWRAYNRAWAAENPDAVRSAARRFRERNPDYDRVRSREYATTHAEEQRAYRQINADRRKQQIKRWLTENPGISAARCAARRARLLQAIPPWADRDAITAIYRQARLLSKQTGVPHHVDHIIPLNHPRVCGLHVETNLQLLTNSENSRKSNRLFVE
jgi:hypothetical protein